MIGYPRHTAVEAADPTPRPVESIPIGSGVASPACRSHGSRSSSGNGRSALRHSGR